MHDSSYIFRLAIVGGGPAGLAPLLAAHRTGQLDGLLAEGVAVVEQSAVLGSGSIGGYAINSDSSGRTFADCLKGPDETPLTRLADHDLAQQFIAAGDGPVSLASVGRFMHLVGEAVAEIMAGYPASAVLTGQRAISARQSQGIWRLRLRDEASGRERVLLARHVVLATGGHQPPDRLDGERIGGVALPGQASGRLMQSGELLTMAGLARLADLLADKLSPRVAIVGGSTSAAAVAHALLHRLPQTHFGPASITLLHRRELRIFYPDRDAALAEQYNEWTEDDVCPVSGRVFRLAGFRLESRELIMRARGIGGRAPEPRLRLHRLIEGDGEAARVLAEADMVIAALGYRPRALRIEGPHGEPIGLFADTGVQTPLVDGDCRVLDAGGTPLDGLFGIGLAAGYVPRGRLGGEPSFRGQANGLWLWQHDVGSLIVDAVTESDGELFCEPELAVSAPRQAAVAAVGD